MSKHKASQKKQAYRSSKKSKKEINSGQDLLEKIDDFFLKKQGRWFWIFFAISVLFTFLLFDLRVSVGGDDSLYIIRANDFIKDFRYPSFQGPLYPIFLSIFVGIFGIKLFVLKLLSAIFLAGHLYFFYRAFKERIPASILTVSIILLSINAYLLFMAAKPIQKRFSCLPRCFFSTTFLKNLLPTRNKTPRLKKWP